MGNISLPVPFDFGPPERSVGLGEMSAPGASVPEASIHEHSEPGVGKEKIGFSGNISGMHSPTADPCSHEAET